MLRASYIWRYVEVECNKTRGRCRLDILFTFSEANVFGRHYLLTRTGRAPRQINQEEATCRMLFFPSQKRNEYATEVQYVGKQLK